MNIKLNKTKCAFCGKERELEDIEKCRIYSQTLYGVKTEIASFCNDNNCAICYQMGKEG